MNAAKLFVLDDTDDNLVLLKKALNRAGYSQVVTLSNPLEAVDAFKRERPDMVLLDYRMPPVDGFYVLKKIREVETSPIPVPAIMLTAGASEEVKQRALQAGFSDFLSKDFDYTELILRIRNALNAYTLNKQLLRNNEELEEMVRIRTHQIRQAHRDTLSKLAIAAEFRDDATGEHTRRVGNLSARIAEVMGLSASFVEEIRMAATLHDVGKIGVPDAILLKPAALTECEYEKVREHPLIGERILRGSDEPMMHMACEVALTHHERWDGRGYPYGLIAEEIPIAGRIVAVADAYDAMTNDRHYRAASPPEKALLEIKACSGRQFDPSVVEALSHIVQNGFHAEPMLAGTAACTIPQFQLFSE